MLKYALLNLFVSLSVGTAFADQARLIVTTADAMQSRVDLVQQAKKEILIEYFIIASDVQTYGGMALLVQAAQRGVKVKVIVDALGNRASEPMLAAFVKKGVGPDGAQNIELRHYNAMMLSPLKMTHRDHSKMIIVDGKLLLTGGRNIAATYFGMNKTGNYVDLDILLNGSAVQAAHENYLKVWNSPLVRDPFQTSQFQHQLDPALCVYEDSESSCLSRVEYAKSLVKKSEDQLDGILKAASVRGEKDFIFLNTGNDWLKNAPHLANIRFLSHKPDDLVSEETAYLSNEFFAELEKVQSEVTLVSPYSIPTSKVMAAFKRLRNRGVRIRMITNSAVSTDSPLVYAGYLYFKQELTRIGVEIYEFKGPDTLHAKAAIFDHKKALICTCNLDPRSINLNREVGIMIQDNPDQAFVKELEAVFQAFRSDSILVAKEGKEFNQDFLLERTPLAKRQLINSLRLTLPAMLNQL
jgi:phosphatidylserine/phosphatidylglycerophosphate/cardiolipin synthase-like enzyme